MRFKIDGFLLGMVAAVALAALYPQGGARDSWLHPDLLNKIGVAVIFFLNGVSLSFAAMRAGFLRWPLHLVVQTSTFLLFPLIGLGVMASGALPDVLGLGFFFLCALPSTVSSSVALTAAAGGNVPGAVFNATLSSLLGVFLTPLWISIALHQGGIDALPLGKVILDLTLWLILPLTLGQLARPTLAAWASRNKSWLQKVDRGTILLIIYTSFCDSILRGVWSGHGLGTILMALGSAFTLFIIVFTLINGLCQSLQFPITDRIAAVFCGSKKTIASGVPMAQIIFGTDPRLGIILLPLMIYHPLQLIICGWQAGNWAKQKKRNQ